MRASLHAMADRIVLWLANRKEPCDFLQLPIIYALYTYVQFLQQQQTVNGIFALAVICSLKCKWTNCAMERDREKKCLNLLLLGVKRNDR